MTEARNSKTVTIIVNTLNRYQYLKNLFESFCHLDYDNFEVVVVNGPSTDETEELLSVWSGSIKAGVCPEANLSMSRNIGIAMAAGEFVAFIDDDAIPEPEWLNQAIDAFERDSIGGVGGPVFDHTGYDYQSVYVSTDRLGCAKLQDSNPCPYNCFPGSYEFPHLAGGNVIFRRSALLEIGGFDEEFQYHLDETDVCLRLVDAGYELLQLPNSFIHHKYAPSYIRDHKHRIPKYRYPTLKSKVYYANRHGREYCTQKEIDSDYEVFIDQHRKNIEWGISGDILTEHDLRDFEQHVKDALVHGKQAADMPQKLLTQKLLSSNASPFKQFKTIRCDGTRLTIVFLCEDISGEDEAGPGCIARDKALEIASLGHKVHVLVHGHDHNTVDFEQGIWVHRILPVESEMSEKAIELNISQATWNQSRAFLDELDRISTYRGIDVVQAAIDNLLGSTVLLSERYRVVSSLSTDEAGLISSGMSSESDEVLESGRVTEYTKL